MWQRALRAMGGEYAELASVPAPSDEVRTPLHLALVPVPFDAAHGRRSSISATGAPQPVCVTLAVSCAHSQASHSCIATFIFPWQNPPGSVRLAGGDFDGFATAQIGTSESGMPIVVAVVRPDDDEEGDPDDE